MKKHILYIFISIWIIAQLVRYYLLNWFFAPFFNIGLIAIILTIISIQIIKIIKKRKNIKIIMIINLTVYLVLLFFTINSVIINKFIEYIDWKILFSLRIKIIEQVKQNELNPNVSWNNFSCELPYEFPIVSNGGNDIFIYRHNDNTVTVTFFVFRNFFEAPSIEIVYTNNNMVINNLESLIKRYKDKNWKIEENWYRIYDKIIEDYFYGE